MSHSAATAAVAVTHATRRLRLSAHVLCNINRTGRTRTLAASGRHRHCVVADCARRAAAVDRVHRHRCRQCRRIVAYG